MHVCVLVAVKRRPAGRMHVKGLKRVSAPDSVILLSQTIFLKLRANKLSLSCSSGKVFVIFSGFIILQAMKWRETGEV